MGSQPLKSSTRIMIQISDNISIALLYQLKLITVEENIYMSKSKIVKSCSK